MKTPLTAWLVRITLTLLILGSLLSNANAQEFTVDQVISKLDQGGRTFKSLESSIERTKVTVLVNDRSTDNGKFYVARQGNSNRVKIDFTAPTAQSMLLDKGKLLLYYPKIKQAQEYVLGQSQDKGGSFIFPGFGQTGEEIRRDYNTRVVGTEVVNGQKTTMLELKPKSPKYAAQFPSIVLWLDEQRWVPLQVRHNEASGDYQIAKFTNIKMNAGISNSVFTVKLPGDVKVSKGTF
jgi:outer membrane lipoprotein-sorting protein